MISASRSLRSTSVRASTATTSTASPKMAAPTSPPVARPSATSSTRAMMGRPSLRKMFQMPETRMASVVLGTPKPHDRHIP